MRNFPFPQVLFARSVFLRYDEGAKQTQNIVTEEQKCRCSWFEMT